MVLSVKENVFFLINNSASKEDGAGEKKKPLNYRVPGNTLNNSIFKFFLFLLEVICLCVCNIYWKELIMSRFSHIISSL